MFIQVTGYITLWLEFVHSEHKIVLDICLLLSFIWCLLSEVEIIIDDYMRYWLFRKKNQDTNKL
jgi:hypothetical protein